MSASTKNDVLRQEEERVLQRFSAYGPEAAQAIARVFAKFGHFRPLLKHLQLEAEGDLQSQQNTLLECLKKHGTQLFMQGVERGTNPSSLVKDSSSMFDQLGTTMKLMNMQSPGAPDTQDEVDEISPAEAGPVGNKNRLAAEGARSDRRNNSPGRRQKVTLDYPNCRRKTPSRRTN
jgi:hypothetical protein